MLLKLSNALLHNFVLAKQLLNIIIQLFETVIGVFLELINPLVAQINQCWVIFLIPPFFQDEKLNVSNPLLNVFTCVLVKRLNVLMIGNLARHQRLHNIVAEFFAL